MNKKRTGVLAVLAVLCLMPFGSGQDKEQDKAKELMRKKLVCAQKVLEGLALNKFDSISDNAQELITLSNLAEWKAIKTPKYELQMNQFRRAAEGLIDMSKEKNLDGAALSYVELTMTCVKCHKYVRDNKMTRLER